ncbi:MAG TPA: hypothetical protein VHL11_17565 [Phototrophicaceae bacterium]|nr:hypothetical protein [Phototrophicaceae bacterium]
MTSTNQRFKWQDRDSAALDLLQLVYHAPLSISWLAITLLEAIRSPVAIEPMYAIVVDEARHPWERRAAWRTAAASGGNLYLPHLADFISENLLIYQYSLRWTASPFNLEGILEFVLLHPSNQVWFFDVLQHLSPISQRTILLQMFDIHTKIPSDEMIASRLIDLFTRYSPLIDLNSISAIYAHDERESTRQWLADQMSTILYLAQIAETEDFFCLLNEWSAFREALYRDCPAIIEEVAAYRSECEAAQAEKMTTPPKEFSAVFYKYKRYAEHPNFGSLVIPVGYRKDRLTTQAIVTHFLGKLVHDTKVVSSLCYLVRHANDTDRSDRDIYAIVRFEAGEALKNVPTPEVWETMIDAFFIRPENTLSNFMTDWIAHLTDCLSGSQQDYSGMTLAIEKRWWFYESSDPS